jgi:hypothetical protein
MSRRGAGSALKKERTEFEFVPAPALARPVVTVAKALLEQGLTSAEVCSLFTHAACALAKQADGFEREEWLDLCAELHDDDLEAEGALLTAPGGSA